MCGIFGFIGVSKNPKVTYDLVNKLFLKTEIRGVDASGFYACTVGDGSIMYDKEPKKSTEYCKQEVWQKDVPEFIEQGVDLFIGHCRQTSVGGGPEKINKNNHPHVSDDRRVAMVHNGKIPEFGALKGRYSVESDCDSEILLRMFESAQVIAQNREKELKEEFPSLTPFLSERLLGMREIFSRVNYGAMAVAIAERGDDNSRYLWLFRDAERPLHVVDMRKTLGQIFFCSTAEIWRNVIEDTPSAKEYIPQDQVIIEFPELQVWLLSLDESDPAKVEGEQPWSIRKFKITKTKFIDWQNHEDEDDKLNFKKPSETRKPPMEVKCRLGKGEEIIAPVVLREEPSDDEKKKRINSSASDLNNHSVGGKIAAKVNVDRDPGDESPEVENGTKIRSFEVIEGSSEEVDVTAFDNMINSITLEISQIRQKVERQAQGNQLSSRDFSDVIDQLEMMKQIGGATLGSI